MSNYRFCLDELSRSLRMSCQKLRARLKIRRSVFLPQGVQRFYYFSFLTGNNTFAFLIIKP